MAKTSLPAAVSAAAQSGNGLLGEVVAWQFPRSAEWPQTAIAVALTGSGLSGAAPRKLAARFAFMRALKKLQRDGLIRELDAAGSQITFQLTEESLDSARGEYVYKCRALVVLDPATGQVRSTNQAVANDAAKLFKDRLETRTVLDVSRLILGLCQGWADLYPLKSQSGVYFVPAAHMPFCDSLEKFVVLLGGKLIRFPVPAAGSAGAQAVVAVMSDCLHDDVSEYEEAIRALRGPITPQKVAAARDAARHAERRLLSVQMFIQSTLTKLEDDLALVEHYQSRLPGTGE